MLAGADTDVLRGVVAEAGLRHEHCADLKTLCRRLPAGAAAVLLPEEAAVGEEAKRVGELLRRHPAWPALPVLVATRRGLEAARLRRAAETLGHVIPLEISAQRTTLVRTVQAVVQGPPAGRRPPAAEGEAPGAGPWLRRLAHACPVGVIVGPLSGGASYANAEALRLLGCTREDLLARKVPWDELTPREFAPRSAEALGKLMTTGVCEPYEKVLVARGGRRVPVLAGAALVGAREAGAEAAVVFLADLTALKRSEQAPGERPGRLWAALEGAAAAIGQVGAEGRIVRVNRAFGALLGYGAEELRGRSLLDLIHPHERAACRAAVCRVLAGGQASCDLETRLARKDGAWLWCFLTCSAIPHPSGPPRHAIVLLHDLSRRRKAEEALRDNQERLRLAVEATGLGTWDYDPLTGKETWSERCKALWGLPPDAPTDRETFLSRLHPEDRPRVREAVRKALDPAGPGRYRIEYRVVHPDGTVRWIAARGQAHFATVGGRRRAVRFIGTNLDVTEAKLAEAALRTSRERLRTLVEAMPQIAWTARPDGWARFYNRRWTRYTGRPEAQGHGWQWMSAVHPEDRERVRRAWAAAVGSASPYEAEYRLRRHDGAYRWHLSRAVPVRDKEGRVVQWIGTATDVHEQREAREELRKRAAWLELAQRAGRAGTWEYDLRRDELQWSEELYALFGLDPAAHRITLERWLDCIHPGDRARVREAVRENLRAHGDVDLEYRILREGHVRWVHARGRVLRGEGGLPERIVGIASDVTDRKRLEEESLRARQAAEAANRAKSRFLAQVSHEIRTPMSGVLGMTELALGVEGLPAEARKYLELAHRSAASLLSIVDDILDLSKIEAGKVALKREVFEVRETLAATLAPLEVSAKAKNLQLLHEVAPQVPPRLVGDPARLQQILVNLVGNAVKFTDRGRVEVRVRLGPTAPAAGAVALLFEVRDTGVGIAPGELDTVFEAFSRGAAPRGARRPGTGLGLAITKQLVERMGGRIWVESEPGKGSRFCFTALFERAPEAAAAPGAPGGAEPALPAPGPGEAGRRPLEILLAEDDPVNQLLAKTVLEMAGHRVAVAWTGRDALDALQRAPFDLVLMDVEMPVMGGLEAARRIRDGQVPGCPRDLPIVALTAHALVGDRERFLAAGMDDYLAKPIQPEGLSEVLGRVLAKRGQTDRGSGGEPPADPAGAPGCRPLVK
ncbi:MAG: hypothetical protein Kow0092_39650 [Deferrisomatales bacterium]